MTGIILGVASNQGPFGPVLTGGTLTADATYYYRDFTTTSGTLVLSGSPIEIDYLLVGTGGQSNGSTMMTSSGGTYYYAGGGGGGGGGVVTGTMTLNPGSYTITIGAPKNSPYNGVPSPTTAFGLTALAGGNAAAPGYPAQTGGSGGGGYTSSTPGGQGTTGQGKNGAPGGTGTSPGGGGGGGSTTAGLPGRNSPYGNGGEGGNGGTYLGLTVGGGGGGAPGYVTDNYSYANIGSVGPGGTGGGGTAYRPLYGDQGILPVTNTGGGGGGGGVGGALGIVRVRYLRSAVGG